MTGKESEKSEFHFSPRPHRAAEIDWQPWGEEAFRLSHQTGKPILLSLSAVWCHWCHVMDETSYSDNQVIAIIKERFVAVRVDSDRRPDINSRYNQGGWPSTVILTHQGEIIAGSTFIPADQLSRLLNDVADLYRENLSEIESVVERARQLRLEEPAPAAGSCDWSMVDFVVDLAQQGFDSENGGFGTEPKFPYVAVLDLLLKRLAADAPGDMGQMLRLTLERMAAGGIFDPVGGGFFRYATAGDWSHPHYEKLLEDNAAMLGIYLEGYRLSSEPDYTRIAYRIHDYLTGVLLDPKTGAFFGSQDADEEYYRLGAAEREAQTAPAIDRTIYAGANALTAASLLGGFKILGDTHLRDQALAALGFVWDHLWDDRQGPFHYFDEGPRAPGLLLDAARIAAACLDAYESGAGDNWLDRSTKAASWILTSLEDGESGGFFDSAAPPASVGFPSERAKPIVDNSVAASMLIRLGQNTGQKKFTDAARRALGSFAGLFQQYGLFAAEYAQAVSRLLDPPVRVTVVGPPDDALTAQMIRATGRAHIPFCSLEIIDPGTYGEDLAETGYGYAGSPVAYICIGASCQPVVKDPVELPGRLESGWSAVSPGWHPASS